MPLRAGACNRAAYRRNPAVLPGRRHEGEAPGDRAPGQAAPPGTRWHGGHGAI